MHNLKHHLLQKLYSREIHGSFVGGRSLIHNKAKTLFSSIPNRLMFYLKDIMQHMGNHILVGTTRCGQFLVTYSYATDSRVPGQLSYRYRLHWWAFRPSAPAYKVAEVQLFDNQDVPCELTVGIAQWAHVNDKLIAYGYSDDNEAPYEQEDLGDLDNRQYYITVTTLPSLHDCQDCKAVAESFDEEDMAANWDSCIGLSCLKHGLTIHTTLDIAPPYPPFDLMTNLKIDNKIIVNTGNFMHVLSFGSDGEEIKASHNDSIVPAEICHNIGEKLMGVKDYICPWKAGDSSSSGRRKTLTHSVNKAWLNTIMDQAEKVYAFEESEDGCEPKFKWYRKRRLADKMYEFCSDDEDMENIRPPAKMIRCPGPTTREKNVECKIVKNDWLKGEGSDGIEEESWQLISNLGETVIVPDEHNYLKESVRSRRIDIKCKEIQLEIQSKAVPSSNNCDCDRLGEESTAVPQQNLVDSISFKTDCDNFNKVVVNETCNTPISSSSNLDSLPSKMSTIDVSIINPDLSALLAEWEADSISSLSPKSDPLLFKSSDTKNDAVQSFLELIPGVTISPRSSGSAVRSTDHNYTEPLENNLAGRTSTPNSTVICKYSPLLVVLRTRNCNQDIIQQPLLKEPQKSKEQEDKCKILMKSGKDAELAMRQRMISGCSVRFDRIYIEVDEEIISTITDIEDDDQGTGFHCALPLSVHGSAYAQLQMVSSHKAEKMNIHCERVYQTSLDIEQFCFKAADIICKCEGFKFWFCNDYDVEIIDVCAFNGDILGVVCIRLNAEKKHPKNERYSIINQRYFYDVRCVFVWNPGTDRCWLEAYSHLVDVTKQVHSHWAPAKQEAAKLRSCLHKNTLFSVNSYPPIRAVTHRMRNTDNLLVPSMEEMRDNHNMIGFRLIHFPRGSTHLLN